MTYTDETYEDEEGYEEDSAESQAEAAGDGETYKEDSVVAHAAAEGNEEASDSECESEKPQRSSAPKTGVQRVHANRDVESESDNSAYHEDEYEAFDSDEESRPTIPAQAAPVQPQSTGSDNADQIKDIALALFDGNQRKAAAWLKSQGQFENEAYWSRSNSSTKNSGTGPPVPPSKKTQRGEEPASKQPPIRRFQGPSHATLPPSTLSTTHKSMDNSNKRKKTAGIDDDLDVDVYQPPSKKGKGMFGHVPKSPAQGLGDLDASHKRKKNPEFEADLDDSIYQPQPKRGKDMFGGFTKLPAEGFGGANSGPSAKQSTKKARRAPAASQNAMETIPGSTWPKSEGDELNRLLRARRDFERTHNIAPWLDGKLFGMLSERLQQVTRREKPRTLNACKNFWNRYGRFYYDCDERGKKKRSESKVTSAQSSKKVQKAKQHTMTAKSKSKSKSKSKKKSKTETETETKQEERESDAEESDHYGGADEE